VTTEVVKHPQFAVYCMSARLGFFGVSGGWQVGKHARAPRTPKNPNQTSFGTLMGGQTSINHALYRLFLNSPKHKIGGKGGARINGMCTEHGAW